MSSFLATFDRIGRNHDVPALNIAGTAAEIAEQVYRYAKPRLASHEIEVMIDLEEMRGMIIVGGFRPAGGIALTCTNPIVTDS